MAAMYFRQQDSDFACKLFSLQSCKIIFLGQSTKYFLQFLFDQVWQRKSGQLSAVNVVSFRRRDGRGLTSPVVDIPKQVPMNLP
jgi:hypothetical protein